MKRFLRYILILFSVSPVFSADIRVTTENPDTVILDIFFNPNPIRDAVTQDNQIFEETATLLVLSSTSGLSIQPHFMDASSIPDSYDILKDAALGLSALEKETAHQGISREYLGLSEGKSVFRLGISSLRQERAESVQWIRHWQIKITGSGVQIIRGRGDSTFYAIDLRFRILEQLLFYRRPDFDSIFYVLRDAWYGPGSR